MLILPLGPLMSESVTAPKAPGSSDSWDDWLVYADWLSERDDARGQLLVLDHQLSIAPDRESLLLEVTAHVDAWREEFDDQLSDNDACFLDEYRTLAVALESFGDNVPKSFLDVFRFPMSWLVATMCTDRSEKLHACQMMEEHYRRVISGLVQWIESAFDGVGVPGLTLHQAHAEMNYSTDDGTRDHRGRWQDIPEQHFRQCDDAFYALAPGGIAYYLPAVMCLTLQIDDFYSKSFSWMPNQWNDDTLNSLTRNQRCATCAFVVFHGNEEEASAAWLRVVKEERDGPRGGWLTLESGNS